MRLSKEEINKIIERRNSGLTLNAIAKEFKVSILTVKYHTDEDFRKKFIQQMTERFRNFSKDKKTKAYERRKEYIRKYCNKRYNEDKEFREKAKERSRERSRRLSSSRIL